MILKLDDERIFRKRPFFLNQINIYGYWPDRTDRNMGIRQTEQTKIAIGQTEGATQIFSRPLWTVTPDSLSATQVGLANTWLGPRTSSWDLLSNRRRYHNWESECIQSGLEQNSDEHK